METAIRIKKETKKKLNLLKYKLNIRSIDETIQLLLKEWKKNEKITANNILEKP